MRMDMEEFQSRFTASDVNDINIITEWRDMATPLRFEAEKIGAEVLSTLGLAVNKTTSLTYEQGLKADLGSVVLAMLRDSGAVKIGKIGGIHAVSVGPRIDTEISKITAKGYEDKYGVAMYKGRTYNTTAPAGEREVGVHRQELMESTPEQAEMIRKQEAMSYSINGGMSVLKEVYGTKEELKKALGKGTRYKSKYMKDAQKSKDREIDISVDSLYELDEVKDANGNSANVWFKWFLSKNGRFGLDSTTVNPQSDKLHRFLVTAESAKATISEEDISDINEEISSSDKSLGFKYAVVQAFDGIDGIPAIDKSSRKKVEEAANWILKMSDVELLGLVKTLGDKKKGHIGHAAAAVDGAIYLVKMVTNGQDYTSTTTMTIDGDGTGASGHVIVENGQIKQVVMDSYGSGYTFANIKFTDPNRYDPLLTKQIASAYAVLPPRGGHGKDAVIELYADTLAISSRLQADHQLNMIDQDFRQFGIIRNPRNLQTGVLFKGISHLSVFEVLFQSTVGLVVNELLTIGQTTFRVIWFDSERVMLQRTSPKVMTPIGELVAASDSLRTYTCYRVVSQPVLNKYSGNLLYATGENPFVFAENQGVLVKTFIKI
jgi:hypothetical protein